MLGVLAAAVAALATAQASFGAAYEVNATDDRDDELCNAAHCSLREAINASNATAEDDVIGFRILAGSQTILITSALPAITDAVVIDGTTQPSYEGEPIIEINGSAAELPATDGLLVGPLGAGTTIRKLVINRFRGAGVRIRGGGTALEGSYIGTDMTGTVSRPNGEGVSVQGASSVRIGGSTADQGNVVSGNNGFGILLEAGAGNRVTANKIGTNAAGTAELGNGETGVLVEEANDSVIGSGEPNEGNTIVANGLTSTGVWIQSGLRNHVNGNSINENGGLGIDLGTSGVTPNDPGDGDEGANNLQNFPVLTSAVTNGTDSIVIGGTLDTQTESIVRLEFFASSGCDSADHGEGTRFLGARTEGTAGGTIEFTAGFEVPVVSGEAITATASIAGNTSEFSKCFFATGLSDTLTVNSSADPGDGECTRAECTLREAIATANSLAGRQTIAFDIAPAGPHTISPASPLPAVTDTVVIDGRTQPGFTGTPLIEVDGADTVEASGLALVAGNNAVRGLAVTGFDFAGILIASESNGNVIAGNYVGTDRTGTIARGNGRGIEVQGDDNTIGGTAPADANVIADSDEQGVRIAGDDNRVLGNLIGTDPGGTLDLGNTDSGVRITGSGNRVGGPAAGEGNTIAFNGFSGTGVIVAAGNRNAILRNSIRTNVGLGIDLGADGITANDVGDDDTGVNELQNFPVLTSAEERGDDVLVTGELESTGGTTYRIELFADTACDGSGNGEGRHFLGSTSVTTTPAGEASFAATVPLPTGNEVLTATATDPAGNTSELSACESIAAEEDVEPMASPEECVPAEDAGRTIDFTPPDDSSTLPERYADLGVHFVDGVPFTPVAYANEERQTSSNPWSALLGIEDTFSSAGIPLTIAFDEPQTAVGFFMGNGTTDGTPTATLTAYGEDDVQLGAVIRAVPRNDVLTYFGVRRADGGILRVTLDYGASTLTEEIDDLCFTGPPLGEGGRGLTLTADAGANPAGSLTRVVPLGSIPSNQLTAFSGAPSASPVGSIPVGSIPVGSIPVGSIPVGSIPVGSIPVGSIPVGSIPVGSIPVGSIGISALPVGSIALDQVLLTSLPVDWTPILVNTPLEGLVLQTLTLQDVYANATARQRFEALTLAASGLNRSLLGGVTLSALLLGNKTLNQIPPPDAPTWCAAITAAGGSCTGLAPGTTTVVGLSVAGAPVGSIPVGSIPVGSIAGGIAGTPVGSIPVGSIDIAATRLAAILLKDIPSANAVVDCSRISCTANQTLGDAAALTPSAIRPNATLALLQAVLGDITLNEIIIGILPRSALPWEGFPLDGLQLFNPNPDPIRYSVDFDLDCANKAGLAVTVKLPAGDVVVQGSTTLRYGNAAVIPGPNPTTSATNGARWTGLPDPCGALASQHIKLSFDALTGFELGAGTASARVLAGGEVESVANQAPVLVHQNWESNDDPATAPTVQPDQLVVGHIARTGDQEVFRVAIPPGLGTVTTVYLSHIGEDAREPGKPADFDLVIGVPGTPPFQSSPVGSIPVGSIPIEDKGSDVENSGQALPPETLQDIPVGSIPVGSISANRGAADEVAQVVSRGEAGVYTIVVRGYNGSYSRDPFVVRIKRTPPPPLPPCPARGLTVGAPGTLPPGVAADRQALFLVNRSRMTALHGAADTNAMIASLNTVAARPDVRGAVLEINGNAAVRTAYAAWDASPCNVEAANNVVRRINDVVAGYRPSLPDLRYVVLLGSDDALPAARVPDRVTISPETDFAGELQFTTQNLTRGNALYAAAALGYFLTDGAYGAFTNIPWLGRELLLPQVSVSRLVESSADIRDQLDQYVAANGVLDPDTALTTGYDFLTDGSEAVGAALASLVGQGNAHTLINDNWTRQQLVSAFTGASPPDDVNAVNAHYSQWQLQPASAASDADLVSTADIPAPGLDPAFKDRIIFTVGCHAGYNVANTLLAAGPLPPQARDWAESWARQRAAVYVANTGFGYGDTHANALSERLMSIFAAKLNVAKPIGELWNDAQHEYYGGAGAYDVYDEKALVEATLFGLPFWRVAGATTPPTPPPPPVVPDPVTGLPVAQLSVGTSLTERGTTDGRFWDFNGRVQVTHFRPIQPRFERSVTVPGQTAHGVIITALVTNDVANVDPVLAQPRIDLAEHERERNFRDVVFPANLVNLTRSRGLRGDEQSLVLNAGQFRPLTPAGPLGIERLVQSIGVEVAYSSSTDVTPPSIRQVGATFTGSTASIVVDVTDPAKRVAALFNDTISWRFTDLTNISGTSIWTATVPATHQIEIAAMAQDAAGNVGYSTNKGFNFLSIADTGGPDILIDSPLPRGVYLLNQAVPARYACSDPAGVQSCVGTVPDGASIDTATPGPKTFTVTATDLGGRETTKSVSYDVRYAFEGFLDPIVNPPKLNQGAAGKNFQFFWKLRDAAGQPVRELSAVTSISSRQINCDDRPVEETGTPLVPPTSDLTYVRNKESYRYTWRTQKAWSRTCRRLVVVLADGTRRWADFHLR